MWRLSALSRHIFSRGWGFGQPKKVLFKNWKALATDGGLVARTPGLSLQYTKEEDREPWRGTVYEYWRYLTKTRSSPDTYAQGRVDAASELARTPFCALANGSAGIAPIDPCSLHPGYLRAGSLGRDCAISDARGMPAWHTRVTLVFGIARTECTHLCHYTGRSRCLLLQPGRG